ncbi:MAG: hypothetical protein ACJAYC_000571 [Halieaceae bacterium]|jgi:hypothetical protein
MSPVPAAALTIAGGGISIDAELLTPTLLGHTRTES